jgi:hypothetical protein
MSLRDFNVPSTDDPTALHNAPLGNGSGLDTFHTRQPEDIEPSNMPKIVGAVAVALMVGAAGVALYTSAGKSIQPRPMVTASNLPATPPAPAPAATPAPDANMAANAPVNTSPAEPPAASTKSAAIAPAPVKASTARKHVASQSRNGSDSSIANSSDASAASARMAADSSQVTNQPQQQATVAQPAAPTPSPSDVATNNIQSGAAVPQGATTASDIPVTPTAPNNSAAPQQNNTVAPQEASTPQANNAAPAQPAAPAQSAGQVNQ